MKSETKINVYFHGGRIGYAMVINGEREVYYRDRLHEDPIKDFRVWMLSYDIKIKKFESSHAGLIAFAVGEVKNIPGREDSAYREYINSGKSFNF
jgi:hypothetical protein